MDATLEVPQDSHTFIELDSHADTSCVGSNCRIISYTDKVCSVSPFHPKYKALENVPIVQAGTAYEDPETGKTYILILNQSLYMGDALNSTLLNLNQARSNGVKIDDVPLQFGGTHSIFIPKHDLQIPLQIHGVLSCLPVRRPTIAEVENCEWIELTSEQEWDPKSNYMQEQELACKDQEHNEAHMPIRRENRAIYPIISTSPCNQEPAELTMSLCCSAQTSERRPHITAVTLAKQWGIGLETAKRTLQATTQLAIRQALHPIQRRFRTEVMQLRYPRLGGRHGRFYTDTLFSRTRLGWIHNGTSLYK
jgi:hypothetical protein